MDTVLSALAKKRIPERVTHNDTKFNNVMLDVTSGAAMCVVDLDTVMPGSPLYDFGDMVRTTTSPTLEDELDLAKVRMTMPMFKGLTRGYLEGLVFYATSFGASLLTIDPANARGAALFDVLVRRTFTAVDDLDAGLTMGLGRD